MVFSNSILRIDQEYLILSNVKYETWEEFQSNTCKSYNSTKYTKKKIDQKLIFV